MFRYARLEYVALNVTDMDRSRQFYEQLWGLQPAGFGAAGELFLRCSSKHHDVVLYPVRSGRREANRMAAGERRWRSIGHLRT